MFGVVLWGFVLGDCYISANRFRFFGYALEEVLILLFVVSGAPLMEVAIDAVFNLDIHGFKLIILLLFHVNNLQLFKSKNQLIQDY